MVGGSHAERLCSLILDVAEVSGPFQMLTGGGKYVKWVTFQMQGICLSVCGFATRGFLTGGMHRAKEKKKKGFE